VKDMKKSHKKKIVGSRWANGKDRGTNVRGKDAICFWRKTTIYTILLFMNLLELNL